MNETDTDSAVLRPVQILLVEDSPADVELTVEALTESKLHNELHVVTDGEAAMAFLRREPPYGDAPRPDLILLDLNLPRKTGREVLAEVKADPSLAPIPVVIMTVSRDERDILESYRLHANCYIRKPVRFQEFTEIVRSIEDFWFTIVTLPPNP
jgi:CheY-like chemotaxis protein